MTEGSGCEVPVFTGMTEGSGCEGPAFAGMTEEKGCEIPAFAGMTEGSGSSYFRSNGGPLPASPQTGEGIFRKERRPLLSSPADGGGISHHALGSAEGVATGSTVEEKVRLTGVVRAAAYVLVFGEALPFIQNCTVALT